MGGGWCSGCEKKKRWECRGRRGGIYSGLGLVSNQNYHKFSKRIRFENFWYRSLKTCTSVISSEMERKYMILHVHFYTLAKVMYWYTPGCILRLQHKSWASHLTNTMPSPLCQAILSKNFVYVKRTAHSVKHAIFSSVDKSMKLMEIFCKNKKITWVKHAIQYHDFCKLSDHCTLCAIVNAAN